VELELGAADCRLTADPAQTAIRDTADFRDVHGVRFMEYMHITITVHIFK
jgi:hypothetical protein